VCLKHGDEKVERVCLGDGPVDAAISAIEQIIKPVEHTFELYQINSVSRGQDTLGDVHVKLNACIPGSMVILAFHALVMVLEELTGQKEAV